MALMITGKAYWAVITGAPRLNKFSETDQWSFDLSIDKDNKDKLLKAGMRKSFVRNKDDERGDFITFVRDAVKKDGTPGKPFDIIDETGQPWTEGKLVGNGSVLNVKVMLNQRIWKDEKYLRPSAVAIQVFEHVPYAAGVVFPVKEKNNPEGKDGKRKKHGKSTI